MEKKKRKQLENLEQAILSAKFHICNGPVEVTGLPFYWGNSKEIDTYQFSCKKKKKKKRNHLHFKELTVLLKSEVIRTCTELPKYRNQFSLVFSPPII